MPIEVASSCEIISRNCSQFLSFLSLCVGRRWWNFENAHKITNKYEQQTIIHHHTYPCTHGCNMLDVATTSARMLGSSENIRDRIQATYNNLYMLSHWRHLKIFEVLLCLSLSLWAERVHGIRETQERDCSAGRGYVSITCPFLFKSLSFSTLCRQIFNPCISHVMFSFIWETYETTWNNICFFLNQLNKGCWHGEFARNYIVHPIWIIWEG